MRGLGTLPGGDTSSAADINDRGQVVGNSETVAGEDIRHAFLWEDGEMTDLRTLPGGGTSIATAINDRGQIVGSSETASEGGYYHAVLWSKRDPHRWRSRDSATGG